MNDYISNAFTIEGENTNLEVNNINVGCITSINEKFNLDSNGNLTVKSINVETGAVTNEGVVNLIYPVGSIYMSTNNLNPGTLFGGVWEQIKDVFLLSCGEIYSNGQTGGEAFHLLSANEMPEHNHSGYTNGSGAHSHSVHLTTGYGSNQSYFHVNGSGNVDWGPQTWVGGYSSYVGDHTHSFTTNNVGANESHNNMPPYYTVYMWKRIG